MNTIQKTRHVEKEKYLLDFKNLYEKVINDFFSDNKNNEFFLNEGYKIGREAVSNNIDLLNLTSIHHNSLINYLNKLTHLDPVIIAEKSILFFEEVVAPFEMITTEFREAIHLLNKHGMQFAIHLQDLKNSIKEKEALLREVYHRVKNNLQVMNSLINLQIESIKNKVAKDALKESASRVKSMGLVHEMLYQSDNLSNIEMNAYGQKLANHLYKIYNVDANKIKFITSETKISLNIERAVTVGLIINEIISNSLKHAFQNKKEGKILFLLEKEPPFIHITLSDNGSGSSSENIASAKVKTLGMRLIYNLTKQLNGKMHVNYSNGMQFKLTIRAT